MANDNANTLDIFGQQPFFTMNTLIYFAFALPPPPPSSPPTSATSATRTITKTAILHTLTNGLMRLYAHFPWLTHGVINEGTSEKRSGTYSLEPLSVKPGIIVRDISAGDGEGDGITMDTLQRRGFPMRSLDESVFAPRGTFPAALGPAAVSAAVSSGDGDAEREAEAEKAEPTPAFLIQATFIPGGLILTFLAQHNCMDMTGQAQIISLLHKACSGLPLSAEEIAAGNVRRSGIVPLLDDSWEPGREMLERHDTRLADTAPAPLESGIWAYFNFRGEALARLKMAAGDGLDAGRYVSTDDALTAVVWQAVVRARMYRLNDHTDSTTQQQSKISRAIDVRPHLGISPMYPGPIQDNIYTALPLSTLHRTENLGQVASRLRSALDPQADVAYHARAFATLLARTEDKRCISSTADFDLSVDVIVSSWARVRGYEWDFGLGLGGPKVVRRPHFEAVEGLVFLMPKTLEGDVAVAVCLRGEDMERLKGDGEFARYGEYIG